MKRQIMLVTMFVTSLNRVKELESEGWSLNLQGYRRGLDWELFMMVKNERYNETELNKRRLYERIL